MTDPRLADDIAEASAVYGMMQLANWFPSDRHANLKESLYDIVFSALHAYADAEVWRVPVPSTN